MTNVRPSSTFLSVPRYTTAYMKREFWDFDMVKKVETKDPDPEEWEVNFFKSDETEREQLLKEK